MLPHLVTAGSRATHGANPQVHGNYSVVAAAFHFRPGLVESRGDEYWRAQTLNAASLPSLQARRVIDHGLHLVRPIRRRRPGAVES